METNVQIQNDLDLHNGIMNYTCTLEKKCTLTTYLDNTFK